MRDRAGFEQGRRRDDQGRPLKLQIGGGTSKGYAANFDQIKWPGDMLKCATEEVCAKLFDWPKCEDCGKSVPKRSRRDRDAALVCSACEEKQDGK